MPQKIALSASIFPEPVNRKNCSLKQLNPPVYLVYTDCVATIEGMRPYSLLDLNDLLDDKQTFLNLPSSQLTKNCLCVALAVSSKCNTELSKKYTYSQQNFYKFDYFWDILPRIVITILFDFCIFLGLHVNRGNLILQAFWRNLGYSGEIVTSGGISKIKKCASGPLSVVMDATTYYDSPALVGFICGRQATEYESVTVSVAL